MALLERYFNWAMNPNMERKGRKLMTKILPEKFSSDSLPMQSAEPEVVILKYSSVLIDRNIHIYTVLLSGPEDKLDNLARMIGELSYQPLRFSLSNVDMDAIQLKSVLSIVRTLLYRDYHIRVNSIGVRKNLSLNTIDLEPYMLFTAPDFDRQAYSVSMMGHEPMSYTYTLDLEGESKPSAGYTIPVYTNEKESMMIKTTIDVNALVGHRMLVEPNDEISLELAYSPLIWVALKDESFNKRYYDDDIVMASGLALTKISTNSNNPDIMAAEGFDLGRELSAAINNYVDMGVFGLIIPLTEPDQEDLYNELASSFNMVMHEYFHPNVIVGSKFNYVFYQPTSNKYYIRSILDTGWMANSLNLIVNNRVPLVNLTGPWVYEFDGTIRDILHLQYMTIKIMAQLSTVEKNGISPELLRFISEVKALPDLTLILPALQLKDVTAIQHQLTAQMTNVNFYSERCDNLNQAVIKRWAYQKALPNVKWMIIKMGGVEYICGDTDNPQARGKLPSISVEDERQVIKMMMDYYKHSCLVDKVNIDEMSSLKQLLDVIISDGVCYDRHDRDVRHLDIDSSSSDMNVRGLYSMGEFKGILENSLPAYGVIDKRVEVGTITIDKLQDEIHVVSVLLEHTIMELFTIMIDSKDEHNKIYKYTEDLWIKGWFLRSWATYWYRTRNMISDLEPRHIFILGRADGSMTDSKQALELLRKTSEMLD